MEHNFLTLFGIPVTLCRVLSRVLRVMMLIFSRSPFLVFALNASLGIDDLNGSLRTVVTINAEIDGRSPYGNRTAVPQG